MKKIAVILAMLLTSCAVEMASSSQDVTNSNYPWCGGESFSSQCDYTDNTNTSGGQLACRTLCGDTGNGWVWPTPGAIPYTSGCGVWYPANGGAAIGRCFMWPK
jgi:hypothetical protein